jgi:hypothetical protein
MSAATHWSGAQRVEQCQTPNVTIVKIHVYSIEIQFLSLVCSVSPTRRSVALSRDREKDFEDGLWMDKESFRSAVAFARRLKINSDYAV